MPDAADLVAALVDLEPIKTWSLIVTLFGDLEGAHLSGQHVGGILSAVGIKPAAQRVALHRLRKDGWILSEKAGREVRYRLSPHAVAQTEAASRDVYRADPKYPQGWKIVLTPEDGAGVTDPDRIAIARNIWLVPGQVTLRALEVIPQDRPPPAWFEDRLVPCDARQVAAGLCELAAACQAMPGRGPARDRLVVRLLVLHRWRRIALRRESWAHIGLFPQGVLAQAHAAVSRVLATSERPSARRMDNMLRETAEIHFGNT